MQDLKNTQYFKVEKEPQMKVSDVIDVVYHALSEKGYNPVNQIVGYIFEIVYKALKEKGYNPVNQIVGYIMSGDPTYITSFNGARSLIMKVERDELVEEILRAYIKNNSWK